MAAKLKKNYQNRLATDSIKGSFLFEVLLREEEGVKNDPSFFLPM